MKPWCLDGVEWGWEEQESTDNIFVYKMQLVRVVVCLTARPVYLDLLRKEVDDLHAVQGRRGSVVKLHRKLHDQGEAEGSEE